MAEQNVDVVVVGGGMVGAALACGLAQNGFSVALLEKHKPPMSWDAESFDLRVSAITRASQHLLQHLGAWDAIEKDRATAYEHMHVWDRTGLGEIHFDAADVSEPDLGHIIENRVIVRALWRQFDALGVSVIEAAGIDVMSTDDAGATLTLSDGRRISAQLVVGADGANSQVRTLAGIDTRGEPYDQHAVVATIRTELGNASTAWQRFMPNGPLALLPMLDDLVSIVWSTTPAEAERLCNLSESEFSQELTDTAEARLGRMSVVGERAAFPLRIQHAERYVQRGVALVGDAAHVIHPLAGQGVNLGFLDAGVLVDALVQGREHGRGIGSMATLRMYERGRKGHNTATQLTMDAFKHLFSNDSLLLSTVRNLGLGAAGRLPPLRRLFERIALGYGLELPKLARPPL